MILNIFTLTLLFSGRLCFFYKFHQCDRFVGRGSGYTGADLFGIIGFHKSGDVERLPPAVVDLSAGIPFFSARTAVGESDRMSQRKPNPCQQSPRRRRRPRLRRRPMKVVRSSNHRNRQLLSCAHQGSSWIILTSEWNEHEFRPDQSEAFSDCVRVDKAQVHERVRLGR